MIPPRFRKTLRDLWANKNRTLVVVVAVAIGVAAVGSVLGSYAILMREMSASFAATKPASAIITVASADATAVQVAASYPGVATAEARGSAKGRIRTSASSWRPIEIFVIPDFDKQKLSLVATDSGRFAPRAGEIVLERSSLPMYAPKSNTAVTVQAGYAEQQLKFVGTVHDAAEAPAWMEGTLYGYVTPQTATSLGIKPLTEVRIRATNASDMAEITKVAYGVKAALVAAGVSVERVQVLKPGVHPHTSQMQTLLFLLEAFGAVAFLLSCVLVAALVNSTLSRQVREIGTLKAVGATSSQVAGIYAAGVIAMGIAAVAIGIPLAAAGARGYASFAMSMLNFDIADSSIPFWVFAAETLVGIVAPLAAAAFPLARGASVTVREAVSDPGISAGSALSAKVESGMARLRGLGRIELMALRNTVRRPGRLALALATLAVGGAGLVAAMSAGTQWTKTVDEAWKAWQWDVEIGTAQPVDASRVAQVLNSTSEVSAFELWQRSSSVIVRKDGTDGPSATVLGTPTDTTFLKLPVLEGRWLKSDDRGVVVVNHLMAQRARIALGDDVRLRLGTGSTATFRVVGIVKEIAPETAYVPQTALAELTGTAGKTNAVHIKTTGGQLGLHSPVPARIEAALSAAGVPVASNVVIGQAKEGLDAHVVIFVSLMSIMSALIVIVGVLGLVSTMSVSVMERVRELGVMQALGATTAQITRMVVLEGMAIGLLSWIVAVAVSLPLTNVLAQTGGSIFVNAPLVPAYSFHGAGVWLVVVLTLSAVASAIPAMRTSRRAVRETLNYL